MDAGTKAKFKSELEGVAKISIEFHKKHPDGSKTPRDTIDLMLQQMRDQLNPILQKYYTMSAKILEVGIEHFVDGVIYPNFTIDEYIDDIEEHANSDDPGITRKTDVKPTPAKPTPAKPTSTKIKTKTIYRPHSKRTRKVRYNIGYKAYPSLLYLLNTGAIDGKTGKYVPAKMAELNKNPENIPMIVSPEYGMRQNSWADIGNMVRKYIYDADNALASLALESKLYMNQFFPNSDELLDVFDPTQNTYIDDGNMRQIPYNALQAERERVNKENKIDFDILRGLVNANNVSVDAKVF